MSTVFSGGTYVNSTCDGSSKTNLIYGGASSANIQARLTTAGWSVISGSGSTNLLMQSAADPTTGLQMRARFKDNTGSCVQVSIENVSGSKASTNTTTMGGHLLCGAGKTYKILASRYRFEIFTPSPTPAREFVCAGMLWVTAPYQGVITEAIYMSCNSTTDSATTTIDSFRTCWGVAGSNSSAAWAAIVNGSLTESFPNTNQACSGMPQLRVPVIGYGGGYGSGGPQGNQNGYRWHDLALDQSDALMAFATTSNISEALIRGQVYDWTALSDAMSIDTTDSWNDGGSSHNFYCLMSQAGGNGVPKGSIWVAYS